MNVNPRNRDSRSSDQSSPADLHNRNGHSDSPGPSNAFSASPIPGLASGLANIDIESIRIEQDFGAQIDVQPVIVTVPCRKPKKQEFVRVHPDEEYRLETYVIEDSTTGDMYLVHPDLRTNLTNEIRPVRLFTAMNRSGDVFLWPVKLSRPGTPPNSWNESLQRAAEAAMSTWVRVESNQAEHRYDVLRAQGNFGDPDWPVVTLQELVNTCFADRFIQDRQHPFLRSLRGEI